MMQPDEWVLEYLNKQYGKANKPVSPFMKLMGDLDLNKSAINRLVGDLERDLRIPLPDFNTDESTTVRDLQEAVKRSTGKFRPPTSWEVYH